MPQRHAAKGRFLSNGKWITAH